MKDKKQTAFIITLALCVVLTIVLYMYLYQPYKAKTESLESSNRTLTTRVNQLSQFYAQMPANQKQIEAMTKEINEILDRFPADVLEEDILYLALKAQTDGANVRYTSINVDEREELGTISEEIVKGAEIEGLDQQLTFIQRSAIYNSNIGYASLKTMLSSMNSSQDEMAIQKVVYVYDVDTFSLKGNVNVDFYSVRGTGKKYEKRTFKDYLMLGHTNLCNVTFIEE